MECCIIRPPHNRSPVNIPDNFALKHAVGTDSERVMMKFLISYYYCFVTFPLYKYVLCEVRDSVIVNKLIKVKPVGANLAKSFVPLTELPPPHTPRTPHSGRRHLEDDCTKKPEPRVVHEGPSVDIHGDYYDQVEAKTVATVIIPDHIDKKHFEVTTEVPYLTVGHIEAIGYHPATAKSEHPSDCEKIYQEHLAEIYSDETTDYSEESLEMARMPLFPVNVPSPSLEDHIDKLYSDLDIR